MATTDNARRRTKGLNCLSILENNRDFPLPQRRACEGKKNQSQFDYKQGGFIA